MNTDTVKNVVKEVTESKVFRMTLYVFGILLIAIFIFQVGVIVGFHKASYERASEDNYSNNLGLTDHQRFAGMMPEIFPDAHGAIGKVIDTSHPPLITVEDKDGTEKAVLVTNDTILRKMRGTATASDLTPNTMVVVLGSPNAQGQIEAKLIRIIPSNN